MKFQNGGQCYTKHHQIAISRLISMANRYKLHSCWGFQGRSIIKTYLDRIRWQLIPYIGLPVPYGHAPKPPYLLMDCIWSTSKISQDLFMFFEGEFISLDYFKLSFVTTPTLLRRTPTTLSESTFKEASNFGIFLFKFYRKR